MIVDTGILFGLADRADRHHGDAKRVFRDPEPKVVPEAVVVEADHLILAVLGIDAEIAFVAGLDEGAFSVEPSTRDDRARAAELVALYRDARIGYVDAITVAIAERLGEHRVATVDRRRFAMVRPRHVPAFDLVPG